MAARDPTAFLHPPAPGHMRTLERSGAGAGFCRGVCAQHPDTPPLPSTCGADPAWGREVRHGGARPHRAGCWGSGGGLASCPHHYLHSSATQRGAGCGPGHRAGSAVGQDTASCRRPSPIGFTPEPPATSPGCPRWGADPRTPHLPRNRLLGSEAVGTREAGNVSAGSEQAGQAAWLLCQAAHTAPGQGQEGQGWDPHPGSAITAAETRERRRRCDAWTRVNQRNPNNIPFLWRSRGRGKERRNPD